MPVIQLTQDLLDQGLVCPPAIKRIEYCDREVPGLLIEVRATVSSVPTWYVRYKDSLKKTCYYRIGSLSDVDLSSARKQAVAFKSQSAPSPVSVPVMAPVLTSEKMTLQTFMQDHYFPHAKMHKRSWRRDDQLYRLRIAPRFGSYELGAIGRREVQLFHNALVKEGLSPASADHHVKLMRRVLNLALEWEMVDKNPLRGLKLFMIDNQVENYLNEEQLQRLLHVLRTDKNRTVCHILMFLLSTGARLNEALTAQWSQIDVDSRVWKIPAKSSKSKKPRSVPLNDSALYVLQQLSTRSHSKYLFPSPARAVDVPYGPVTRVWHRIRKIAGVEKLRIHDLRHSFASLLVSGGRSLYEVQQILGHSDPKITMRYAHLSSEALRDAANVASVLVPRLLA
jgi:integrase